MMTWEDCSVTFWMNYTVTKIFMTEQEYSAFTTSKYMGLLYENKCAIVSCTKQFSGNNLLVEFSEAIDLDIEKDVYIPFIREYNNLTLNET